MNRVFENHVVTMRESDNGMSSWRPNRMMSSKATKFLSSPFELTQLLGNC